MARQRRTKNLLVIILFLQRHKNCSNIHKSHVNCIPFLPSRDFFFWFFSAEKNVPHFMVCFYSEKANFIALIVL